MQRILNFHGINSEGQAVQIIVTSEQNLEPEENLDLALRQVALEAAKSSKEAQITVSVAQKDHRLSYYFCGIHKEIALANLDQPKVLAELAQSKIISAQPAPGLESLIDRFAEVNPRPRSTAEKIGQVLAYFFEIIRVVYQYISQLWGGISRKEELLRLDVALLSEISQSNAPESVTQIQALRYIAGILEKERSETADPLLEKRIKGAIASSEKLENLRRYFKEKKFDALVKEVRKAIETAGTEPLLLPVGFFKDKELYEMLLEIKLTSNGTYSLALISASPDVRTHFDRERGVENNGLSIRREIENVEKADLLGAIPLLIELQTSPACAQSDKDLLMVFLRALEFNGSTIPVAKTTEAIADGAQLGRLGELISYATLTKQDAADGKRFEMALRLRAFLDIVKANPNGLQDIRFWTLVRTTSLQLAHLIEQDKHLLGSKDAQGMELTRIYHELRSLLDQAEETLPQFNSLNYAPRFSSPLAALDGAPIDPELIPLESKPNAYPEVQPLFQVLNPAKPLMSIKNWAERLTKLASLKQIDRAGYEAKLMVRMFPEPTDRFWTTLSEKEAKAVFEAIQTMSFAISRALTNKPGPTLQDIASLVALIYFCRPLLNSSVPFNAHKAMLELFNSHISLIERDWLQSIFAAFDNTQTNPVWEMRQLEDALSRARDDLPLPLHAPNYAKVLLGETNNAALVELCPFGCGRDDHFELAHGHEKHDYPTAYLLHNHEIFDPRVLMKEGVLHRDEAADLLYVQQTNQNPPAFREKGSDREPIDNKFDLSDRCIQLANTFALYFDHPHFFKHPALRRQFEMKIFNYGAFTSFLIPKDFEANRPFLTGIFHRLSDEIRLSKAAGDLGEASYLVYIAAEMQDLVQRSRLSAQEKATLAIPFDCDALLAKWALELIGENNEGAKDQQKMLFPLLLSRYYQKFCQNPSDACFNDPASQELMLLMIGRLKNLTEHSGRLDPEIRDHSLSILHWIAPKVRARAAQDKTFVNQLLATFNPRLAALNLEWESEEFPTLLALDRKGLVYEFDLLTGKLSFGKAQIEPLPDNIRWDGSVRKICKNAADGHWRLYGSPKMPECTAYQSEDLPNCRILALKPAELPGGKQRKSKVVIQKKINGQWMTHVPLDSLPEKAAFVAAGSECWMAHKDGKFTAIHVLDERADKPRAVMHLGTSYHLSWSGLTKETILSNVWFPKEEIYLLDPSQEKFARFAAIEDPHFIQISGHRFSPSSVRYLRYRMATNDAPLLYEIDGSGVHSKIYPDYRLQPFGKRPGQTDPAIGALPLPRSFDGFHLLEKDGKELVLVPLRQYDRKTTIGGAPLPQSKPVLPGALETCPVFEYTLNPATNRLSAKSAEAYAYLAYLAYAHWDYDAAAYYLEKARTSAGLGEIYQKICGWLRETKDTSPNGVAVQLRFALLHASGQDPEKLCWIADLYSQYKSHQRIAGVEGRDASLDLSSGEEETLSQCLRTLLQKWGDKTIEEKGSLLERPADIPMLEIDSKDPVDQAGFRNSTKMIWESLGNDSSSTEISFNDLDWTLRHFRDLFNRILDADAGSMELKRLEQSLRAPCHHPLLQNYLLKLVSAKKNNTAGAIEKLPKLQGPWFASSRKGAIDSAKIVFDYPYFDKFSLAVHRRALDKTDRLIENYSWTLGLKARRWLQTHGQSDMPKFRSFLLEQIFGSAGAATLEAINRNLTLLDVVPIAHPIQQILPLNVPALEAKEISLKARYGHLAAPEEPAPVLLPDPLPPPPAKPETWGDWLSSFVFAPPAPEPLPILEEETPPEEPSIAPVVTTDPQKIQSILDPAYLRYFVQNKAPPAPIDDSFFDRIQDPELQRLKEEHRLDLKAYAEERTNVSLAKADELKSALLEEREERLAKREDLRRSLLQMAEQFDTPGGILAMRRLVGKGVKPTIDMLISLWRRGEIEKLKELGLKKLPDSFLQELDVKIQSYLEMTVGEHHLGRILELMNGPLNDPQQRDALFEALAVKRHFALDDPDARDLLFLEFTQEIVLRKQQVAILREMLSDPNAVRQLRMGDGKSKVLLPMLAKRKATGKNLVLLMLPEELYETNCRDLDETNRHLFGQTMNRFDFSRRSDKSEEALRNIHQTLLKTVREKGFAMTTKSSMLSFRNAYLELFSKLASAVTSEEKQRLLDQIRQMSATMELFGERTAVIADEIDACLDVRKEVNYSLDESEALDPVKADVGAKLMSIILEEPALADLALALQQNTQAAFSPQAREGQLRDIAISYLTRFPLDGVSPKEFADYTANKESAAEVEKRVFALKKRNPERYKELTTVKAYLDRGFSTTLARVGNVNFGRDPVSGVWTIPYKASNSPRIGSEFDDDIEKMAFTLEDYLQNGATIAQTQSFISAMHKAALQELRESDPNEFLSINETEAGKAFSECLKEIDPEHRLGRNMTLPRMNCPDNIETLTQIINETAKSRLAFCYSHALRKMRQFPAQIHSVSLDVTDMVKHFGGFTGTPWNLHTYDDKIRAKKNLGVDGSTWALILKKEIPVKTFTFDAEKPIDSLLEHLPIVGEAQALIDTGAYLRGTDNVEFIDRAMEIAGDKVAAGIYFDAAGRIVKKTKGETLPIDLAPDTDLMQNLTLYDQAHTVGADIKQGQTATAVVTIGENTFIRDLFQSVWRMRQVHRAQNIVLAVSDKIKERILAGQNRPLTKEDILAFCLKNEASREAEDNYRAEKEKIEGAAKRKAAHGIARYIVQGASDAAIEQMAKIALEEELFVKQRPGEGAFDQYGTIKRMESPQAIFERTKDLEADRCRDLAFAFRSVEPIARALGTLGKTVEARPPLSPDICPPQVKSSLQEGGEIDLEAEAEAEMEMESEVAAEQETEEELELTAEILIPQVGNGEGGHGAVEPLDASEVKTLVGTGQGNISKVRPISHTLPFFDPNIHVSAMFERNFREEPSFYLPRPQSVFYSNRKPVKQVLIAKEGGRWIALIPSTHEAHGPCQSYFAKHTGWYTEAAQCYLSASRPPLLRFKTGKDRTDALPFSSSKDRAQFYRLYVQVKLFKGEIEYVGEEKEALKLWLQEKGPKEFKKYFEENILPTRPRRFADAYPKSTLGKLFAELTS